MRQPDEITHNGKTLNEWLEINKTQDANLSDADLRGANLRGANLRDANLSGANLRGADLRSADLSDANLSDADLRGANLRGANLRGANLSGADLRGADLRSADLSDANLRSADLSGANLSGANLRGADLRSADLSDANLRSADLRSANLSGANLSGCKGLITAREWLKQFAHNELGIIVYKRIGNTSYPAPDGWVIEPGQYLEEVCNMLPTLDCACGVNFATREWCKREYKNSDLWECLVTWQDVADICVPYNTDGKARCGRLMLVRKVTA